jgi:hypothetical protein
MANFDEMGYNLHGKPAGCRDYLSKEFIDMLGEEPVEPVVVELFKKYFPNGIENNNIGEVV